MVVPRPALYELQITATISIVRPASQVVYSGRIAPAVLDWSAAGTKPPPGSSEARCLGIAGPLIYSPMIRLNLEGHCCRIAVIDRDAQWRGLEELRNRHELELDKIDQALRLSEWSRVSMVVFRVAVNRSFLDCD